jgi:hypothetical protein
LWELDNLHRSRYLLSYIDSLRLRRNVQRALDRGESYRKLVRAVAYANAGKLLVRTDLEQQLWSECSRLLANCVTYYNACVLSQLLEYAEREKNIEVADRIKQISPVSWNTCELLRKVHLPRRRRGRQKHPCRVESQHHILREGKHPVGVYHRPL